MLKWFKKIKKYLLIFLAFFVFAGGLWAHLYKVNMIIDEENAYHVKIINDVVSSFNTAYNFDDEEYLKADVIDNNSININYKGINYNIKYDHGNLLYDFDPNNEDEKFVFTVLVDSISIMHGEKKEAVYDVLKYAALKDYDINNGLHYIVNKDNTVSAILNTKVPLTIIDISKEKEAAIEYEKWLNRMTPEKAMNYLNELGSLNGIKFENLKDIFYDKDVKNNLDMAIFAKYASDNRWGYVWGTFGNVLTESYLNYSTARNDYNKENEEFLRSNYLGRHVTDCVGLLKAYGWFNPDNASINYRTNNIPDWNTDMFFNASAKKGPISTIPEVPGLAVWYSGHIGVYIGNGKAVEAMNIAKGVRATGISYREWTHWFEMPNVLYYE